MTLKVYIVDYHSGNLHSIKSALDSLKIKSFVSNDYKQLKNCDAIILPGVGSFNSAMKYLSKSYLSDEIKFIVLEKKVPLFGICLGFQLLFSNSQEFGENQGLSLIDGYVTKLKYNCEDKNFKIPNIGWRKIEMCNAWIDSPLKKNSNNEFMYFIHSFHAIPKDKSIIISKSTHGDQSFCSSILKDNIFGTQFHPEKSGKEGLKIYINFFNFFFS